MTYTTVAHAQSASFPTWDDLIERYSDRLDNTIHEVILDAIGAATIMANADVFWGDIQGDYPQIAKLNNLWLFSLLNQAETLSDRLTLIKYLTLAF